MDVRQLRPQSRSGTRRPFVLFIQLNKVQFESKLMLFVCFFLQIRLALKDWEYVKKFEKDAVDAQHLDVVYLLRQLVSHKAFYFTAMPTLVSCLLYVNTFEPAVLPQFDSVLPAG